MLSTTARNHSAGFSLLELVIVCALISILVAIALVSFANRDQAARFQAEVASRIRERRASAIRINALTEATSLETFRQPPISIDFRNLQTTAALVVEGQADRTAFNPAVTPGTLGTWNFVYHGRELQIPTGWRIANSASELSPLPLIPLGVPTASFNFAADGRLDADSLPPTPSNTNPNAESPFPTIYLTNGNDGRAVAVHPSGLLELWQYDDANRRWIGFSNRTVTDTPTPVSNPTPTPCSLVVSPNPLSIPINGSAIVTVTLSAFTSTDTILATASGAARITVSPSSQQVTGQQAVQFTVSAQNNNGSVNFFSPCGSTNVSVRTFRGTCDR